MNRLTRARDLSMIATAGAVVTVAIVAIYDTTSHRRTTRTSPPVDPAAPHGWLHHLDSPSERSRPALKVEADAYARAIQDDPAGMVGYSYDGTMHLPGDPGYLGAFRYFHVTPTRPKDSSTSR